MKNVHAILPLVFAATAIADRTFTVKNNCGYTVWPAIYTDPNVGSPPPDQTTGWEAAPGTSVSFSVADNWAAGRIWGRQDCDASGNCATGQCVGGIVCTLPGDTPASLAEFTLGGTSGGLDNYDVSLVDGSNIPIAITNNVGCPTGSCPVDLNVNCPAPLQDVVNGAVVGCRTACSAGLAPDPNNSPNCCTGDHGTPATCPPSGVEYYSYFKDNCPDAYAYAYDESSGTALWTCSSTLNADYTITFCP